MSYNRHSARRRTTATVTNGTAIWKDRDRVWRKSSPELHERLPIEPRKTLLHPLLAGVNRSRDGTGALQMRIVQRGGLVGERSIKFLVGTIRGTERQRYFVEQITPTSRTLARKAAI
jgi:hypothetical protein